VMMIIKNRGALTALVEQQAKFGGDVGFTLVVAGKGVEGATTTQAGNDIVAYALPILGLYGGFTLEGGVLARRLDLNQGFYGQPATPQDILFNERFQSMEAEPLRNALAGQPR
jgi:lipid-binding SYLF domain-containing protein